ncbi:hypothetical protein WA026_016267 [Henosepilachna vigintioctopunctata]|uniref:Uncharacterized protein n=1 Tax=Henosepilachna vigintioctopunctata TaxID=420089 RepID=A0AAW1UKP2_9CUCU
MTIIDYKNIRKKDQVLTLIVNQLGNDNAAPNNQDNEPSGSEGADSTHVPDPSSDQALEEPEPSIIFPEEELIFLRQVEDSNVDEQKGVAEENEKMMAPPAKRKPSVNVINELLARNLNGSHPDDYVGIRIDNSNIQEGAIGISLRKVSAMQFSNGDGRYD